MPDPHAGDETPVSDVRGHDRRLLHLVPARAWELVGDRYAPESLRTEGFVHLSAPHQLAEVAAARFAGRSDLLLLVVDPARLDVEVVWEDTTGEGHTFPHAYGSLPREAVVAVHAYRPDVDGRFPPPWEVTTAVAAPGGAAAPVASATLRFVDVSRAGHVLSRGELDGLPPRIRLGALLERRVRDEVAATNARGGRHVAGLVQPQDAVRYSDGFRLPAPRTLDAGAHVAAVRGALQAGLLHLEAGDRRFTHPDVEVPVADLEEVTVVLQRPVVARDAP